MSVQRLNFKRWMVERSRDDFEDVGADSMEVLPSGALKFTSGTDYVVVIIYAPGQWITVYEENES